MQMNCSGNLAQASQSVPEQQNCQISQASLWFFLAQVKLSAKNTLFYVNIPFKVLICESISKVKCVLDNISFKNSKEKEMHFEIIIYSCFVLKYFFLAQLG